MKKKLSLFALSVGILFSNTISAQNFKFIDRGNMNFSVKPGDDFVEYSNGTWVKNHPIPAKESRWGSFNEIRDFNIKSVKLLLEETVVKQKSLTKGSVERRVADFYVAAMDSLRIESLGFDPIKSDLKKVQDVQNREDLIKEIARFKTQGLGSPFFGSYVGQDRKNVKKMVPQFGQGGTSLPDRDYYLKSDTRTLKIQEAFKKYISTLFELIGTPINQAKSNAEQIFLLEKRLATAQMARVEMRDPYKTYNKFLLADFQKKTPLINWSEQFKLLGIPPQDSILVGAPNYLVEVNNTLTDTPIENLKAYLTWNILKGSASYLSSPFVKASFDYAKFLSGQETQTPRWQRMSTLTDGTIGELLGQLYVAKHFKPEAKERMKELLVNMRTAFAKRINSLDWMTEPTKKKALDKLNAFTPKVGYPDQWKTYDGLDISADSFYQNMKNASIWAYQDNINQIGKPVDRTRWGMTPPTVNAYYNATMNEIVFPAGILQFPFFSAEADDALNYGGIAAVIGHEMSHGFDDSGSQYDNDGTLRNWWTPEDLSKFKAKTVQLGAQFDQYTVVDTIHVNGKFTMGENIGDLGGLNIAYEAFKMTKQGQSKKKIDGLTPDQRFFLAWAQVWRGASRPEMAAQMIKTDPHSPGQYRTIGTPVNMDAWYEAFNVKPGDKLYKKPEDRIKIW
jgi:putative endopeptidase